MLGGHIVDEEATCVDVFETYVLLLLLWNGNEFGSSCTHSERGWSYSVLAGSVHQGRTSRGEEELDSGAGVPANAVVVARCHAHKLFEEVVSSSEGWSGEAKAIVGSGLWDLKDLMTDEVGATSK